MSYYLKKNIYGFASGSAQSGLTRLKLILALHSPNSHTLLYTGSLDLKSTCLTLLVLFLTSWFVDTISPNSRNLSCSERLDPSKAGKSLRWDPDYPEWVWEEDNQVEKAKPVDWNQVALDQLGLDCEDVQVICFIAIGVGSVFVWISACIYNPEFRCCYLQYGV